MRKLIFAGWLLACLPVWAQPLRAQNKPAFQYIDSITWAAFARSDWPAVRISARDGFRNGVDFYYLRMRAGIAEFRLKNYDQAIRHFEKALKFNNPDPYALDYLYHSYLLNNREGDAARITPLLSRQYRDSLNIRSNPIKFFTEGGYYATPDKETLLAYNPGGTSAHNYQVTGYNYLTLGTSAVLSPSLTVSLGFQRINYLITEQYQVPTLNPFVFDVSYGENSFYSGARLMLAHGLSLLGGFRFLNGEYVYHNAQAYPGGFNFVESRGAYSDLASNLTLSKRSPYIGITVSGDMNRFKGTWYGQSGASLALYPMGNLNFYLVGEISRTGTLNDWVANGKFVGKGRTGIKVLPFAWLETSYTRGWIRYWSENQAYVVYNNFDPITSRFETSLVFARLLKHLDLSLRYSSTTRIAGWEVADPSGSTYIIGQDYTFHSLILGGTWNF